MLKNNCLKGNASGFSLIELIIVVLIIGIVATIAIPSLLAARRSANQGSCIASLRSLHSAQSTYQTSKGEGNYAGTESNIGDTVGLNALHSAELIDMSLGSGTKSGYNFVGAITLSSSSSPATFFFSANPVSISGNLQSGTHRYNVTQVGIIRADSSNLSTTFDATNTSSAPPLDD